MHSIIRQPLLHFLLLGALLFTLYSWIGDEVDTGPTKEIVVTPGRIQTLSATFEKVWQRPPTETELEGLINDFITEEIFYREALAIGLDQDDTIVRRRMRQKMEFISADLVEQIEPTEEELLAYLNENKETYRWDPAISFSQIYINPDAHGKATESLVKSILNTLNSQVHPANIEELGDRIMLGHTFEKTDLREIDRQFGKGFGESLLKLETNSWQGPVASGFGLHLVFISKRTEGRYAELEEVRDAVVRDWTSAKIRETNSLFVEAMKSNYLITIEKPSGRK